MSAPTMQLSEAAEKLLGDLAGQTGLSPQQVLEKALAEYERKVFFDGLAADFAALKADPEAWAAEQADRKLWDNTLMDGLDPDERWTEDGRAIPNADAPG